MYSSHEAKLKLGILTKFDVVFSFPRFILTFLINVAFANSGRGLVEKAIPYCTLCNYLLRGSDKLELERYLTMQIVNKNY